MGRKRAAETPSEQPIVDAAPKETVSKADAVRAALAEGIDSPDEGVAFIRERFGIEMGKTMWSSYKSQEKTRQAKASGGDRPRVGRPPVTPSASIVPPAPAPAAARNGSVADSLKTVKELVDRLGADEVIKIAEIFRG